MDKAERGDQKTFREIAENSIPVESGTSLRKETERFVHCMPTTNHLFRHKMALIQGVWFK